MYARAYHTQTIVAVVLVGDHFGHRCQVMRDEVGVESLKHAARRVVQPRRRSAEFVERLECGFEVHVVEQLEMIDQITLHHEDPDALLFGIEALL